MNFRMAEIAQETVNFINAGGYLQHRFNEDIFKARLYTPNELKELSVQVPKDTPNATVTVYNQDTCECAKRFASNGYTCILNFASAKHVGGGFLGGAVAQEECICRMSTLYASINSNYAKEYYIHNNQNDNSEPMYSDYTIFSPCVEVIRNGQYDLLDTPYTISAITSPAVNVHKARGCSDIEIFNCMLQRAEYILKIAVDNQVKNLILGAWGCGVFGNNPKDVAQQFKHLLFEKGYIKCFENVSFAVYDRYSDTFNSFKEAFQQYTR